jgi:hypothetical protein
MLATFPAIPMTGMGLSSMLAIRLYRDPTDARDNFAFDAQLLEFDAHYEIDSFGSNLEYVK